MAPIYSSLTVERYSEGPQKFRFRYTKNVNAIYRNGDHRTIEDIRKWCEEQFDKPGKRLRWRFRSLHKEFYFRDMEDAFAFKMRWC